MVARQPVFDERGRVVAFELLYRRHLTSDSAEFSDPVAATASVLLSGFVDIGLSRLAVDRPVLVNCPRAFLVGEAPIPVPPEELILEVVESVGSEREVLEGLRELKRQGYRIALDRFEWSPSREPLLAYADWVKIDVSGLAHDAVRERVERLRHLGVRLVAQRVQTASEDDLCRQLGFDLFQGNYYRRPQMARSLRPSGTGGRFVRLLGETTSGDFASLKRIISQDVALTYRFLKLINSASFPLQREVRSVSHAVTLLGERRVRQWLTVAVLASVEEERGDLLTTSLLRGGMCEVLGLKTGIEDPTLFTAGLLSSLDALLGVPLQEVVAELPLDRELTVALLRREGPLGVILDAVIAYEAGKWAESMSHGHQPHHLRESFLHAARHADELRRALVE